MSKLNLTASIGVGERLRIARSNANITQKDAAHKISVARTTLVAIEKGQRRARIDELQKLAKLYGSSVNALLRQEAVHVDLAPRFRKLSDATDHIANKAIELLSNLAKAEVELENLLGIKRARNYPLQRPILRGEVKFQAEQDALELRERLGIGKAPITNIVTLLEMEMGVRVYIRRFNSRISGLFAYEDDLGPCMLLNANHSKERRAQSAAHECGHLVSTRGKPDVLHANEINTTREEKYANIFGRVFLAPPRAVMEKFQEATAGSNNLTRRHVIILSHFFGISREAMVRRLEELDLVRIGTWDWFVSHGGITAKHIQQVLGDLASPDYQKPEADRPTTIKLSMMAAEVYRQELMSEGQLARLLCLDRIELREMMGLEIEGSEMDESPNIIN